MKKNPNKVTITKAQAEKMKKQAFAEAVDSALAMFLTVLYDKEGMSREDIQRIGRGVQALAESVTQGYVSISDLKHVLKTEYDIELR